MARNPELEQLILENPESQEAWLVYGDWLSAQGDPRGQIIALENSKKPPKTAIKNEIKTHQESWLTPITGKKKTASLAKTPGIHLEWKNGFLSEVTILQTGQPQYNDETYYYTTPRGLTIEEKLKAVLDSEAANLLQRLAVQFTEEDIEATALGTTGSASLRELYLGDLAKEFLSATTFEKVGELSKKLPRLERLTLHGICSRLSLGNTRTTWTKLRWLSIVGFYFDSILWESLSKVKLPELEELHLDMVYSDITENDTGSYGLAHILQRKDLKKLKKLTISGTEQSEDLVQILLDSTILPQLTHLYLQRNDIEEAGAKLILSNLDRFRHLELLDLDYNTIRAEPATQLRAQPWINASACHESYSPDWA